MTDNVVWLIVCKLSVTLTLASGRSGLLVPCASLQRHSVDSPRDGQSVQPSRGLFLNLKNAKNGLVFLGRTFLLVALGRMNLQVHKHSKCCLPFETMHSSYYCTTPPAQRPPAVLLNNRNKNRNNKTTLHKLWNVFPATSHLIGDTANQNWPLIHRLVGFVAHL